MDDLLTTQEVAKLLGVGTTSIKRWSDEGKLPAFKTAGGHRRYRREDVEKLLQHATEDEALHARLSGMSRREIDALAVGVVQLDDAGMVLLYNAAEARFAGISAEEAEGKCFFTEVAPCTNNRILMGRFREGIRIGQLDARIDYTFTYRMRPTFVALHLYRDPQSQTNWLIVDPRL